MAYNYCWWLTKIRKWILVFVSPVIFVSCGGFQASQHPDDFFRGGRNISSFDELDLFMGSTENNPQFRKAEVTTSSGPLRLKTEPETGASSPTTGPTQVAKGEEIDVYWPLDIVNNHIKIFYQGLTLWVTHKSSGGREYVTLLEDLSIPSITAPGGFVFNPPPSTSTPIFGEPVGDPGPSADLRQITLSSSALREARLAVEAVGLTPFDVPACTFNPAIGNQSSPNNCYERIVISRDYKSFIANHGWACARQAAQSTFGQNPGEILFHSSGAGQVRRNRTVSGTSRKSVHATGQAIDLFAVSLYFSGGNTRKIKMHRDHTDGSDTTERQNHSFYWAYVNCWREKIQRHAPCNCSQRLSGAITYLDDGAHYNHVHMSLPLCERSRYNVSCV